MGIDGVDVLQELVSVFYLLDHKVSSTYLLNILGALGEVLMDLT